MNIVGLLLFIASSALLALDIFEYINGLWARIAYILPLFLASALISQRWYSIINLDDTITPLDKEGLSSKFIGLLRKIYSYYPFLIPILPTAAAIARPTERVLFALTGETINVSSSRVFSLYIGGTPFSAILIIFIPGSLLTLIYQWVPSFVSIITTSRLIILMMLVCISSLFVSLSALFLTYLRTLFARRI